MTCRIRFLPADLCVEISPGTSLLEAATRAGLPIAQACGSEGICARCGVSVLDGNEKLPPEEEEERKAKERNRIPHELRLACRLQPTHDLTVTTSYWSAP
ncbi:MAG: 2Fe-2S iron-sulfur cluster-binding protein [Myxococcota bacterium]|nr:2Fe-2S iron-sulfur cluster-binding protein [Myxococcota bacterium]